MSSIVLKDLVLPANTEMKEMKTAVLFTNGVKKAYLKGSNLEITNPIKELGKRVKRYSETVIEKCHLGLVQAAISDVSDTVDLQKILNRYFKTKSSKKVTSAPAVA